uniref:Uncharacterized protein n=1 Tax=Phlebotomus papatasi TaxID=29031 RepID=A0A1B0DAH4_PHLPP
MYEIMCSGWLDPDSRFKPQSIFTALHVIQQKYQHYYYPLQPKCETGSLSSGQSRENEQIFVETNGDLSSTSTGVGSQSSIDSSRINGTEHMDSLEPSNWPGSKDFFPDNVYMSDEFKVVRQGLIGSGNYGAVYRGEIQDINDHRNGKQVAIKVLDITQSRNGRNDFDYECKIMKALKHPNIVQIFDVITDDANCMAIVMEYVENSSLDGYLRGNHLINPKPAKLLEFAKDIASLVPSHRCCYVPWGGREHSVKHYEVLCNCSGTWISASRGNYSPHALPGGTSEKGETLYIGRANHKGSQTIGKIQPSHKLCYIPYAGKEIGYKSYEVFVPNN